MIPPICRACAALQAPEGDAPNLIKALGLAGRGRRALPLGISRAAKGWAQPRLDEQVFREEDWKRAAGRVPKGRSAATWKEDGPAGPSHRFAASGT